eukprot:3359451-Rhodomonas_salina.2
MGLKRPRNREPGPKRDPSDVELTRSVGRVGQEWVEKAFRLQREVDAHRHACINADAMLFWLTRNAKLT